MRYLFLIALIAVLFSGCEDCIDRIVEFASKVDTVNEGLYDGRYEITYSGYITGKNGRPVAFLQDVNDMLNDSSLYINENDDVLINTNHEHWGCK